MNVFSLGPYHIGAGTPAQVFDDVMECVMQGVGGAIFTLNLGILGCAARDTALSETISSAILLTADGMPIVWASKLFSSSPIRGRTTGVYLAERLISSSAISSLAIIGGHDPLQAVRRLAPPSRPNTIIYSAVVSNEAEDWRLWRAQLIALKPQVVLIALGLPRQMELAVELGKELPNSILIGVGGAIDYLSGYRRRAPGWMQEIGLEWLFRLLMEPKRLWRRYLIESVIGLAFLVSSSLRER